MEGRVCHSGCRRGDVVASGHFSGASGWVVGASGVTGDGAARGSACRLTSSDPVLVPVPVPGDAQMVRLLLSILPVGGALAVP